MQVIIVARCAGFQQYAFEHTLQDSEFAQDKISTHFTMLNVLYCSSLFCSLRGLQTPMLMVLILER